MLQYFQSQSCPAREDSFAGVMSKHQHLVSLINFKKIWQPQCTSWSHKLVHQGALKHVHYVNIVHMLYYLNSATAIVLACQ